MGPTNIGLKDLKVKNCDGTWVTLATTSDASVYLANDTSDAFRYYVEGIWDNKERNDNMEILKLYRERCEKEIKERYNAIIDEEYNNLEVVKEYNELVNTFKINMKQLAEKYNTNDEIYLVPTCYNNDYAYELSNNLRYKIRDKYDNAMDTEIIQLRNFVEEIEAVLSISDDKDYQIEVLKNYEILDKKGKLNI